MRDPKGCGHNPAKVGARNRTDSRRGGYRMKAYALDYTVRGQKFFSVHIEAKDLKSAKKKLGRKHGYKDGRMIKIDRVMVCGYF